MPVRTIRSVVLALSVVMVVPTLAADLEQVIAGPHRKAEDKAAYYGAMFPEDDTSDGGFWKRGRETLMRDMGNKDLYGTIHL